jgi:hypothetical protein
MSKAESERYLNRAQECMNLADRATSDADKVILLQMAEEWLKLSEQAGARDKVQ